MSTELCIFLSLSTVAKKGRESSQGDASIAVKKVSQTLVDGLDTHAALVKRLIVVQLYRMGTEIALLLMFQRFVVVANERRFNTQAFWRLLACFLLA
jgi:hypothetical protein